jgi:hypothetical protein
MISLVASASAAPSMKSQHHSLVAWSDDGASALMRIDEIAANGNQALAYAVAVPGEALTRQFRLSSKGECPAQAAELRILLGQLRFGEVHVDPSHCPKDVVTVSAKAAALMKASLVAERRAATTWFAASDYHLQIRRGEKLEVELQEVSRPGPKQVALSPSGRLLVFIHCTTGDVCWYAGYRSATGKLADLRSAEDDPRLLEASLGATVNSADDADRAWWDSSSKGARSPVEVSFTPEGDHPYSCVRSDGTYFTALADDTGSRIDRQGHITDDHGKPLGAIGADGKLRLQGKDVARLDDQGRLFCHNQKEPFAQIDAQGVIRREGASVGFLRGDRDWRHNRRAALLVTDVCSLQVP